LTSTNPNLTPGAVGRTTVLLTDRCSCRHFGNIQFCRRHRNRNRNSVDLYFRGHSRLPSTSSFIRSPGVSIRDQKTKQYDLKVDRGPWRWHNSL